MKWTTIIGVVLAVLIVVFAAQVRANIFTDTIDAIRGHIDDVESRINHEDTFVSGDTIATSRFRDTDVGRDAIHWADGSVSIIRDANDKWFIQLHTDFNTGPAPDLYIYLAERKVYDESSFWAADPVELSKLSAGSGAQYYELKGPVDSIEVIIWCKRFGAFIGATTLEISYE